MEDARSDLDGLRSFDSNADGVLDASDDRISEFGVWQDLNSDGLVDAGEILSLEEAGVASIDLNATAVDSGFSLGDVAVVNEGQFTRTDGSLGEYADAAITFFERGEFDLPEIEFGEGDFARKSTKYRLSSIDGVLSIADKKGRSPVSLTGSSLLEFKNRDIGLLSTIILDLDGDGIDEVRGNKTDAWFDVDGNGRRDDTGWVGQGDGFLVVDINGNGTIDNGSELSFMADAANASGALQGLSLFDSNGDGIISNLDIRFVELQVWVDGNANGITDIGELRSLDEVGIASIDLEREGTNDRTKVGRNIVQATSSFTRSDGSVGNVGETALSFTPGADLVVNSSSVNSRSLSALLSAQEPSFADFANISFDDVINGTFNANAVDANAVSGLTVRSGDTSTTLEPIGESIEANASSGSTVTSLAAIDDDFDAPESEVITSDVASTREALEDDDVTTSDIAVSTEALETDSDDARLALITQDMNSFGSSSGIDTLRRQNDINIADIFAA